MRNISKKKLSEGKAIVGSICQLENETINATMGRAGFDFILIDMQHSPIGVETLDRMIGGLSPAESEIIVRVRSNDIGLIGNALDMGADGIIIPLINAAEEVVRAVAATRYSPTGTRSWAPRRTDRYGGRDEYTRRANEEMMVLPMIESAQAVENLDEILDVVGIDGIMVGPADLALSMGHPPGVPDLVQEAIERILRGCKEHGVPFGMFTGTLEAAETWLTRGGQIATVGSDVGFTQQGVADGLREIKELLARL